jgi:hypothetical protein
MAAFVDFPPELTLDEIGSLQHNFPAFGLDVVPLEGVSVSKLATRSAGELRKYGGTLTNGLDVPVKSPAITVFPVNRVGRPLGVATSAATTDLAPSGTWTFETSGVSDPGSGYAAYPDGSIEIVP